MQTKGRLAFRNMLAGFDRRLKLALAGFDGRLKDVLTDFERRLMD